MNTVLTAWSRLGDWAVGRALISGAVWLRAPYFLTAAPVIEDLAPGRARVRMYDWWLVHNHLGTVHAIASCNLAEYSMGVLAEASVPESHRWIPTGMEVSYRAKASGTLRATASLHSEMAFGDEPTTVPVEVAITDTTGREVVHATISIRVSPRAGREVGGRGVAEPAPAVARA